MKYYLYDPDTDSFAGIMWKERHWDVVDLHFEDIPVLRNWKPVLVEVLDKDPPVQGDFPTLWNYGSIPVMSQRAWDVLHCLIDYCCEALPIIHPSGHPYCIIHVMQTIPALNEQQSNVSRNAVTGRINNIYEYSLKDSLIEGKHIFKLPLEQGARLLVDEEFRKCVEANHLKGLVFKDLPMATNRDRNSRH